MRTISVYLPLGWALVALFFTHSFWAVLIVFALLGLFYAPDVPIAESILVAGVRRWGYDYGFLRMWGSIAFIFATIGGGFLFDLFGGAMVLPSMAAFVFITILMGIASPRLGSVAAVRCKVGDMVERHQVLAEVAPVAPVAPVE